MLELDYWKLESLMANLTLVWHLIRVSSHVSLQRSSIPKRLSTFITLIRSVCVVLPHVAFEISFCEKSSGTQMAANCFFSCVLFMEMDCQLFFRFKSLAAVSITAPELQVSMFCLMLISGGLGLKSEATV